MKELFAMIKRTTKLFFKDKGMLFSSLITPLILLVLYSTFLSNVYKDSFVSNLPEMFTVSDSIIDALVGSQLLSSLLAVSCITVAFCSNLIMVQDKVTGAIRDITVTPVKKSTLALSYYISTVFSTLIICLIATGAGFLYLAKMGWYLTFTDVLLILLDVFLLVMFGTALSSIINVFLTSQGQMSAVGTIVSSGYGFICGAYMPISNFSTGLQTVLSFLPGTYGTSLIRNHIMRGVFDEMGNVGFPAQVVDSIKDSIDCNIYFFDNKVSTGTMFAIMCITVAVLVLIYVMMNLLKRKQK
ncbi:MAG: ABC transporter permease [Acutalibacteraceae bacterium]